MSLIGGYVRYLKPAFFIEMLYEICEEGTPEEVFGNPQKQETKDFLARFRNT